MQLMKHSILILVLTILTACSSNPVVVPVIEPVCPQTKIIKSEYGSQEWLNELGVNIVKLQECIKSWEVIVRAHNDK